MIFILIRLCRIIFKAIESVIRLHGGVAAIDEALGLKRYSEEFMRTILAKRYRNRDFSDESWCKDVNIKVYFSPLFFQLRNPKYVDLWIKAGADVCQVVDKDLTILDFALSVKDTPQKRKVLDLLIESGAYTNFSLKHIDNQAKSELLASIKRVQKKFKVKT